MKVKDLVYYILDSVRSISDDSLINEDHVIFLIKKYRSFFIKKDLDGNRNTTGEQSDFETQMVCLDLEKVDAIPGFPCAGEYLRSVQKLPKILDGSAVTAYPEDFYGSIHIAFVPRERMRFVGTNKFLMNITYMSLGPDGHVYITSNNPQFIYLKKLRVSTVFEDFDEAAKLTCDCEDNEDASCDPLDAEFPVREYLVPQIIEAVEREVLGVSYRPADTQNNAADDLASIQKGVPAHSNEQ